MKLSSKQFNYKYLDIGTVCRRFYRIYLNARRGLLVKFAAQICDILNSLTKRRSTKLHCLEPDHMEPQQGLLCQVVIEISALLRYYYAT